jgi:hypothetical protein
VHQRRLLVQVLRVVRQVLAKGQAAVQAAAAAGRRRRRCRIERQVRQGGVLRGGQAASVQLGVEVQVQGPQVAAAAVNVAIAAATDDLWQQESTGKDHQETAAALLP